MRFTGQLIRYGAVGLVSNGFAYSVYLLLTQFGIAPITTALTLYIVGAFVSYLGNYKWTFISIASHKSTLPRFILAHVFGILTQLFLLSYLYESLGINHQLAQLVTVVCVAIILFISFKLYVFPRCN